MAEKEGVYSPEKEVYSPEKEERRRESIKKQQREIEESMKEAGFSTSNWSWETAWGAAKTGEVRPVNFSGPDGAPNYLVTKDLMCQITLCTGGNVGEKSTGLTRRDGTVQKETISSWTSTGVGSRASMKIEDFIKLVNGICEKLNKE